MSLLSSCRRSRSGLFEPSEVLLSVLDGFSGVGATDGETLNQLPSFLPSARRFKTIYNRRVTTRKCVSVTQHGKTIRRH